MGLRACYDWGQVLQARGALTAAADVYEHALETVSEPGRAWPPFAGMALVGLAEVAYERGDLDVAAAHATAAVALCRQVKYVPPLAAGLAVLALIRHAQGDASAAMALLDEAGRRTRETDLVALLDPTPAVTTRLRLAEGDIIPPDTWTRRRSITADDAPSYPRERDHLILARLLLADDRPDQALALLDRLHDLAVADGRVRSRIEVALLRARAHDATSDDAAAVAALDEAIDLAAAAAHLRVFLDEGAALVAVFRQLLGGDPAGRSPGARAHLARVVDAFAAEGVDVLPPTRRGAVRVPELMMHLTPRELEVLVLLAAGKPNQRIADELVVTLDTVKKHVSHILEKLQADNRTEAVTRARTLDLIS